MKRILPGQTDAIIVPKAGRSAKAPLRNSLHTHPAGVVDRHRQARRELLHAYVASLRSPHGGLPSNMDSIDPTDLTHVIDKRIGELDMTGERPRHALASLTSATNPMATPAAPDAPPPCRSDPLGERPPAPARPVATPPGPRQAPATPGQAPNRIAGTKPAEADARRARPPASPVADRVSRGCAPRVGFNTLATYLQYHRAQRVVLRLAVLASGRRSALLGGALHRRRRRTRALAGVARRDPRAGP
jgi:hypothetical protein